MPFTACKNSVWVESCDFLKNTEMRWILLPSSFFQRFNSSRSTRPILKFFAVELLCNHDYTFMQDLFEILILSTEIIFIFDDET